MTIHNWSGEGINSVYPQMVNHCMEHGEKVTQRGLTTRELTPVIFQLADSRQRLVTSYGRPVNVAFALAEVLWILTGRDDVEMLAAYNSRISDFSDDGVRFNAAYGQRMRHTFGIDQIEDAIKAITRDPGTRQAVLQINHPAFDGSEAVTKDRACNVSSHMLLRDGRLNWTQFMRSNDALWGTPYNVIQWTFVQEYIAARLGVELGTYTHVSDSFHIYDPPLDNSPLPDVRQYNLYHGLDGHEPMSPAAADQVYDAGRMEEIVRTGHASSSVLNIGKFWTPFMTLFAAHRQYTDHQDYDAYDTLEACTDEVYKMAQLRFYAHSRWLVHPDEHAGQLDRIRRDFDPGIVEWMLAR